jgi:hypothetical protein
MSNAQLLPGFGQSRTPSDPPPSPTPEDPREREPIHDPPIEPEHDADEGTVRQAHAEALD